MKKNGFFVILALIGAALIWRWCARPESADRRAATVRLATTTSVVDSGVLDALLAKYPERVEIHAVGSGKALELLDAGKADVAIVHGVGVTRGTPLMHNDFVLVGPRTAPLAVGDMRDAMRLIAQSGRPFVSRGDESGTHQTERKLWAAAGVTPAKLIETRAGMKATLERASKEQAYALTDRGTFVANRKALKLAIVFQGDDELVNTYAVAGDHPLAKYLLSDAAREIIGAHGVAAHGEPLFTPVD